MNKTSPNGMTETRPYLKTLKRFKILTSVVATAAMTTTVMATAIFASSLTQAEIGAENEQKLRDILAMEHRTASSKRDPYRHPVETLSFFDIKPDMTVVEVSPGGYGWYTEILAPYLHDRGTLYAAHHDPESNSDYYVRSVTKFKQKFAEPKSLYGNIKLTVFAPPEKTDLAPAGTVDRVLTFRNVHNWYMNSGGNDGVLAAFSAFYTALKPGGMLGVVDHKLPEDKPLADQVNSGYMKESYVIALAKQAGFELVGSSDINLNPKDNSSHPRGVWSLPPSLRMGDVDRGRYLSIGESTRMTLKFRKPES